MAIWKIDELGEFVTLKRGYDLPQQKRKNGEIPIFSSSGVTGTHNEAMVEAPGVITGRYGTIGEVFLATSPRSPRARSVRKWRIRTSRRCTRNCGPRIPA